MTQWKQICSVLNAYPALDHKALGRPRLLEFWFTLGWKSAPENERCWMHGSAWTFITMALQRETFFFWNCRQHVDHDGFQMHLCKQQSLSPSMNFIILRGGKDGGDGWGWGRVMAFPLSNRERKGLRFAFAHHCNQQHKPFPQFHRTLLCVRIGLRSWLPIWLPGFLSGATHVPHNEIVCLSPASRPHGPNRLWSLPEQCFNVYR